MTAVDFFDFFLLHRTILVGLHLICALVIYNTINRLSNRKPNGIVTQFMRRFLLRLGYVFLGWNLSMAVVCFMRIDGVPMSDAGMILWPSLCILFTLMLIAGGFVIMDDSSRHD